MADLNSPGWVLVAGEWRWTGAGESPDESWTGCTCDAIDGDHDRPGCAIYAEDRCACTVTQACWPCREARALAAMRHGDAHGKDRSEVQR